MSWSLVLRWSREVFRSFGGMYSVAMFHVIEMVCQRGDLGHALMEGGVRSTLHNILVVFQGLHGTGKGCYTDPDVMCRKTCYQGHAGVGLVAAQSEMCWIELWDFLGIHRLFQSCCRTGDICIVVILQFRDVQAQQMSHIHCKTRDMRHVEIHQERGALYQNQSAWT